MTNHIKAIGSAMQIEQTNLRDCLIITPPKFGDDRGFFSETYNAQKLAGEGITTQFVQDNHSMSATIGTLRGLHYQAPPFAQDKLVRVTRGRVIDVAVDVRKGSSTYAKHVAVELSAENGKQLLVPKGFLHGFITLEENTEFLYKVSNYYSAECDGSVRFNSPDLGINWGMEEGAVRLSDKDKNAPLFSNWESPFIYGDNL